MNKLCCYKGNCKIKQDNNQNGNFK